MLAAGGRVIGGRYEVERELGRGAEGRVLLAHDRAEGGAPRAIKLVAPAHEARLRWEFGLLRGLSHPNLAGVHDLLRLDAPRPELDLPEGTVALVLEHVEGLDAASAAHEAARDQGALLALTLRVGQAVARGLSALHGLGLVHGDVKPHNVLVAPEGDDCKLVDLGLSALHGEERPAAGTPGYMAPEVWAGERSPQGDLFALGVTLAELLRGAPEASPSSLSVAEHLGRALASASAPLPAWVPPPLATLLDELRAPEASRRPARAREVAARLLAIAKDAGLSADAGIGGGADDAPTPAERAGAMTCLPLTGRDGALARLGEALAEPGVRVVWGPSGAGRSRLVREAARRLQAVRAAAGGRVPSYREAPSLPAVPPEYDCILHVASPAVVDPAAAARLCEAAAVSGRTLCLVLESDAAPAPGIDAVELAPLPDAALEDLLVAALGKRPSAALAREARAASGGLPGRLCRLLAAGALNGADLVRPAALRALAEGETGGVPPLPPPARALAEVLAVAGGELDAAAAGHALADEGELGAAAGQLKALGLAVHEAGALVLRRDLVAALRRELPEQRLRALADRLAAADLPERARAHLALATGDMAGAGRSFLSACAGRREQGAPEQAARVAREALEALPAEAAAGPALRLALADALRASGHYAEARAALDGESSPAAGLLRAELSRLSGDAAAAAEQAAALSPDETDPVSGELTALRARLALDAGDFGRARALASAVPADAPGGLRAREVLGLACVYAGDLDAAGDALAVGLERARASRSRAAEARLHAIQALLSRARGDLHGAARAFAAAAAQADAAGEYHATASFLQNVGTQRLDCGEPGPAIEALRDAARRLSRLDRPADLARVLYNLAYAAHLVGDGALAGSAAARARATAERAGDAAGVEFAACLAAEVAARAGELAPARKLLATPLAGGLPRAEAVVARARRVALAAAAGDAEAAERELSAGASDTEPPAEPAARVELAMAGARVALLAGRATEALAQAEAAQAAALELGAFDLGLTSTLLLADAARAAGDGARVASSLARARSQLDTAARSLDSPQRARLRAVPEYRAALEAVPVAPPVEAGVDPRFRALSAMAKRLHRERRLPRLYEAILDAAVELSGAERGYLLTRDADGRQRVRAARGLTRSELSGDEHALSRSIVGRVIGSGRPVTTMDAVTDERLSGAASVHSLSLRSVLAVPLRLAGEVAGALYLEDRLRPFAFGDAEVSLLGDLADLAATAIDSAQLLRAARRDARRLRALRARLARQVEAQALELEGLRRTRGGEGESLPGLVGHSAGMRRLAGLARRVARSEVPVLLRGESGTGKELAARAIHELGARADRPFIGENCSAIPEPLLESTLFGHVRGAFTGADRRHLGLFELADGGTLFLDEVGEMSAGMQARLLRVLQDGEVRPVGSERARQVDVRVIAATHRDLEQMVSDGSFREDLYYRLAVVTLELPPLRERSDDVGPLVAHFMAKHAPGRPLSVERRALSRLAQHPWPGNVRQLENEVRRALVLAEDTITEEHLSPQLRADAEAAVDELDLKGQVNKLERRLIRQALDVSSGNQTRAARLLGVSRYGLQKMLKRLGDDPVLH